MLGEAHDCIEHGSPNACFLFQWFVCHGIRRIQLPIPYWRPVSWPVSRLIILAAQSDEDFACFQMTDGLQTHRLGVHGGEWWSLGSTNSKALARRHPAGNAGREVGKAESRHIASQCLNGFSHVLLIANWLQNATEQVFQASWTWKALTSAIQPRSFSLATPVLLRLLTCCSSDVSSVLMKLWSQLPSICTRANPQKFSTCVWVWLCVWLPRKSECTVAKTKPRQTKYSSHPFWWHNLFCFQRWNKWPPFAAWFRFSILLQSLVLFDIIPRLNSGLCFLRNTPGTWRPKIFRYLMNQYESNIRDIQRQSGKHMETWKHDPIYWKRAGPRRSPGDLTHATLTYRQAAVWGSPKPKN